MKVNEPFNNSIKSAPLPDGMIFRTSRMEDLEELISFVKERNPHLTEEKIRAQMLLEIDLTKNDPSYFLFVAVLDGKAVGFSRLIHSDGLPIEKKKLEAPSGFYMMGAFVTAIWRRHNISRFMFEKRISELKKLGATSVYSAVDVNNLTSIKMHQEFGYVEVKRGPGFLNIDFGEGTGILFKKEIQA